jgi:hypothetical protein
MIVIVLTKLEATTQILGHIDRNLLLSPVCSEPGAGTLDFTYAMTTFTWHISVQSYCERFSITS